MHGRRLAWLTARPIAHRGLHDRRRGIPENSLAAFAAAVRGRYAIELDVRVTADGEAVVFHDRELGRLTGQPGVLEETKLARVRNLRLLGTGQHPPTLAEVLALVANRVPVVIELKPEDGSGRLETAVLRALRGYGGRAAVMSFAAATVAWFQRHAPDIVRGRTTGTGRGEGLPGMAAFRAGRLLDVAIGRPHFVSHETVATGWPASRRWRRRAPLITWTVRSRRQQQRLHRLVDAVTFEGFRAR